MSLTFFINQGASASVVALPSNGFNTFGLSGSIYSGVKSGVIYSGVKFAADGMIYERQAAGGWSSIGTWLLNGTNSDFYIVRTIDSGTLTTDAGAGPLVLSTDREYDVQQSSVGTKTTFVSFEIQNVGSSDTFVDGNVTTGTDRVTLTGHPFTSADSAILTSSGTLPAGLALATTYYIKSIDANTVEFYSDVALANIVDITAAAGGGTHTISHYVVKASNTYKFLAIKDF